MKSNQVKKVITLKHMENNLPVINYIPVHIFFIPD